MSKNIDEDERLKDLSDLVREVRLTYYQMRQSSADTGLNVKGISGAYGLMADIFHQGPQTIPQLLKERALSRQYLHRVINTLEAEGLIEFRDNPSHKRSKLVALSEPGLAFFENKRGKIMASLVPISEELSHEQIKNSLHTLMVLREGFKDLAEVILSQEELG